MLTSMRHPLRRAQEIRQSTGTRALFRHAAGRILWASGLSGHLNMSTPDGLTLNFFPSAMSFSLWVRPSSFADLGRIAAIAEPSDTVVDVGANIGYFSLLASKAVGDSGRVIAFEPDPRTFGFLKSNLESNDARNVEAHRLAVSRTSGSLLLAQGKQDTMNRLVADRDDADHVIHVEVISLDSLDIDTEIGLLKVDAEGYDYEVLAGATKTLSRTRNVVVECSERQLRANGTSSNQLVALLLASGFDVWKVDDDGRPTERVDESYVGQGGNLLGTRDSAVVEARQRP